MEDDNDERPPASPEDLQALDAPEGFELGPDGIYKATDSIDAQWAQRGPYVIPLSLDGREALSFEPRQFSGWASYVSDEFDRARALLLLHIGPCDRGPDAPLAIREVRLMTFEPVNFPGSSLLRLIPWERVEAAVNQPSRREVLTDFVDPRFPAPSSGPRDLHEWPFQRPKEHLPEPNLHLEIPEGYRKPDAFYAEVAERFLQAAAISARPAQDLAEANEVKPTTVHRWIREAKARSLLALPGDRKPRATDDTTQGGS
ncbi:hypothetical protein [Streptomyces luteogriseus]|uniref:hypothetical protein n=1 Tax=Streptomyces luteogriseus TaxID=68233 RepID=UPI003792B114